ncbi:MAG: ZIP family metal transporter [Armatimonadota bacterium]
MPALGYILLFSILGSVGAIGIAALFLFLPAPRRERATTWLISYAAGTLIGVTLLELLPTALERADPTVVLGTTAVGIVFFFTLEKFVLWHHCHDSDCQQHQAQGPLILIGDTLHNIIDGVVIAAAFLASIPIGISTAIAVILHEIFQEVGDLAILVSSGYTRRKAILFDVFTGLTAVLAAVIAYFALERVSAALPYVLALSAAGFLYIALADLVPLQHRHAGPRPAVFQILLQLAGVGTVLAFEVFLE